MVQTQFRYSIAEYESAIANFRWGNQALPDCLQMKLGRDYNRIAEGWDDAGLESKISHAAMLIGGYVPHGDYRNLSHGITPGNEMLCRHIQTTHPPSDHPRTSNTPPKT